MNQKMATDYEVEPVIPKEQRMILYVECEGILADGSLAYWSKRS